MSNDKYPTPHLQHVADVLTAKFIDPKEHDTGVPYLKGDDGLLGPGWYVSDGVEAMGPYQSSDIAALALSDAQHSRDGEYERETGTRADGAPVAHPIAPGRTSQFSYVSGTTSVDNNLEEGDDYTPEELHAAGEQPCCCRGMICSKHLALAELAMRRPKVVVLCGSTRFHDAFIQANYEETMLGNIVLSVGFARATAEANEPNRIELHGETVGCTPEQKLALDELHKRKIDMADEVLVLNVGGYIGKSTASEIEYAERCGRPIRWLEPPVDICPGCKKPLESTDSERPENEIQLVRVVEVIGPSPDWTSIRAWHRGCVTAALNRQATTR